MTEVCTCFPDEADLQVVLVYLPGCRSRPFESDGIRR